MSTNTDDFLEHFGVKGMKWGVRRKKLVDNVKTNVKESIQRPVTAEARVANSSRARINKHGTDALTNKQLQDLVTRMNLEQQYATLSQKPSIRSSGRAYVGDILKEAGKTLLTDLIVSGVKSAAGRRGGRSSGGGGFTDMGEMGANLAIGAVRRALTR